MTVVSQEAQEEKRLHAHVLHTDGQCARPTPVPSSRHVFGTHPCWFEPEVDKVTCEWNAACGCNRHIIEPVPAGHSILQRDINDPAQRRGFLPTIFPFSICLSLRMSVEAGQALHDLS